MAQVSHFPCTHALDPTRGGVHIPTPCIRAALGLVLVNGTWLCDRGPLVSCFQSLSAPLLFREHAQASLLEHETRSSTEST